jgi:hypothetical protein
MDLAGPDHTLQLEVQDLFTIGAFDGEDWETFAGISSLAFDGDGNLFILDDRSSRVVKVDSRGHFVAEFGREGEGPGEFTRPGWLSVTAGGEVRVFDHRQQRFTFFHPDGTLKQTARIAGGDYLIPQGGLLSLPEGDMVDGARNPLGIRMVMSGEEDGSRAPRPVSLFRVSQEVERATAFSAWNPLSATRGNTIQSTAGGGIQMTGAPLRAFDPELSVGVFPDGRLAVVDSTTYTVKVVELGAGVTTLLRRPHTPRPVTRRDREEERDRQLEAIVARGNRPSRATALGSSSGEETQVVSLASGQISAFLEARVEGMKFADEMPVIASMAVDPDGQIWVARTGPRVGKDGPIDVLDLDDGYLGSVDPSDFRLPDAFGPSGLVAYVETDELDVPHVVVKRVTLG